jgi:hypothetical protein
MVNTIIKSEKIEHSKISINSLLNDIYLLPKWEKIKEVSLEEKRFFFIKKTKQVNIFRKFSVKNNVEKYSLRTSNDEIIANIDLRVYKDNVYIINMNYETKSNFEQVSALLLQVAAEKALYNTTDKQLKINLSFPLLIKNKLRKMLLSSDFVKEAEQSQYEIDMFGEIFVLDVDSSSFWQKKIKQMNILINK